MSLNNIFGGSEKGICGDLGSNYQCHFQDSKYVSEDIQYSFRFLHTSHQNPPLELFSCIISNNTLI
jgi:hypothetical protein